MATANVSTIRDLLQLSKEERTELFELIDEISNRESIRDKKNDPDENEKDPGLASA